MKNLTPFVRHIYYWDKIVANKNLADRNALQAIRPLVLTRFNDYIRHSTPISLNAIAASTFVGQNISRLKKCYSTSNSLASLKTRIKERQDILLRSECQYCNISESNTFDHYLPQVDFPEFSALSVNLIPCCSKCNSEKGEEWLLPTGNRKFLNYYYDTLPTIQFLNCTIAYTSGGIPQANFTINSAVIPLAIRPIILSHYRNLLLKQRYKERSNSEITDVYNSIIPLSATLTRAQIQSHLRTEGARMKVNKGENYWRAILKIALSNSNTFLTSAGY